MKGKWGMFWCKSMTPIWYNMIWPAIPGSLLSDIELISMQDTTCNNIPLKSLIVRSVFIISTNVNTVTLSFYQTSQCLSVQFITPNTTFCVLCWSHVRMECEFGLFFIQTQKQIRSICQFCRFFGIYLSSFPLNLHKFSFQMSCMNTEQLKRNLWKNVTKRD